MVRNRDERVRMGETERRLRSKRLDEGDKHDG